VLNKKSMLQAQIAATDPAEAVRMFYDAVYQPETALVLFFCSSRYCLETIEAEMTRLFGDVPVVGCTTAGEIGPEGYGYGTITGASFSADCFCGAIRCFGPLKQFDTASCQSGIQELLLEQEEHSPWPSTGNSFGFLLIDGLSRQEETVARAVQAALGRIPLVGGSAADSLDFNKTWLFSNGHFRTDCAVLVLITTPLPFKPLMIQHFISSEQRAVVTSADTGQRIVHEIDGRPAAVTYAELTGVKAADLSPAHFAASPVALRICGNDYVRGISEKLPDGSLSFYCAVDEGVVLRTTKTVDLVQNLMDSFAALRNEIGPVQMIIGCDCILRRLEAEQSGLGAEVATILKQNRVVGFNTYGEQYRGIHVNQTFTGIAIGTGAGETT